MATDEVREIQTAPFSRLMNDRSTIKEKIKHQAPPVTEVDWFEERGRLRGVDFTACK